MAQYRGRLTCAHLRGCRSSAVLTGAGHIGRESCTAVRFRAGTLLLCVHRRHRAVQLRGLFALYEAWHKLSDPHPITEWRWVPSVVLFTAVVLEGTVLRTAVQKTDQVRGNATWVQFIRRSTSPDPPVILLEDTGALIGLLFALTGVTLTLITGSGVWDGLGSAAIGTLLVVIAIVLAIEVKSLLIGESAVGRHVRLIGQAILSVDDIGAVIHMRTMHLGPEELLVAAKVAIDLEDDVRDAIRAINEAETRIRDAVPIARVIYLEPDVPRGGRPTHGASVDADGNGHQR